MTPWAQSTTTLAFLIGSSEVAFRQIPSRVFGVSLREWSLPPSPFRIAAIAIDPAQELLVIVEPPTRQYTFPNRSGMDSSIDMHEAILTSRCVFSVREDATQMQLYHPSGLLLRMRTADVDDTDVTCKFVVMQ